MANDSGFTVFSQSTINLIIDLMKINVIKLNMKNCDITKYVDSQTKVCKFNFSRSLDTFNYLVSKIFVFVCSFKYLQ